MRIAEIAFKGQTYHLGDPPKAGERAPDFAVERTGPGGEAETFTLADLPAKPRLLSVLPEIVTRTCSLQTRTFNERLAAYRDAIAAYTVSVDPLDVQADFCSAEGVGNLEFLSDGEIRSFARDWGLEVEETGRLARAVFVLDEAGTIAYAELVPELTEEPDYDAALAAVDSLLAAT